MKIVTAAQMQALDRRTITEARIPGLTLMSRAGASVVAAMERVFAPLSGKAVAVVCGKGNNGGDGFVVARLLRQKRARARVLLMSQASDLTGDARTMYRRFMREAGKSAVHVCPAHDRTRTLLESSDLIVDALLGTGLSAPVTGPYRTTIEAINDAGRPVIAVDLPSGIHADTGVVLGTAVRAFLTITFGLPKLGLYVGAGIDHAGEVHVADIGIPPRYVDAVDSPITLLTLDSVRPQGHLWTCRPHRRVGRQDRRGRPRGQGGAASRGRPGYGRDTGERERHARGQVARGDDRPDAGNQRANPRPVRLGPSPLVYECPERRGSRARSQHPPGNRRADPGSGCEAGETVRAGCGRLERASRMHLAARRVQDSADPHPPPGQIGRASGR